MNKVLEVNKCLYHLMKILIHLIMKDSTSFCQKEYASDKQENTSLSIKGYTSIKKCRTSALRNIITLYNEKLTSF